MKVSKVSCQKFFLYFLTIVFGTFAAIYFLRIFREEATKIPIIGAIAILFLVCLLAIIILAILRNNYFSQILNNQDLIIIFLLLFFFNYNLYGIIPFNASRSNSIIMMSYLNSQNGIPKNKIEIRKHLEKVYFDEYDAVQKRLDEQVAAGNLSKVENGYVITKKGKFVINFFAKVTDFYKMNDNFAKLNEEKYGEK